MGHQSAGEGDLFVPFEPEGHESPHTEGKPTFLKPPALCSALAEVGPEPMHSIQAGYVDLPPPFIPSPISPSRPKSPWGRFDPYDSTEVILGDLVWVLKQREETIQNVFEWNKSYLKHNGGIVFMDCLKDWP